LEDLDVYVFASLKMCFTKKLKAKEQI
jgi:hypothetical protein